MLLSTQTGPCTPSLFGCLTWPRAHGYPTSESEDPLMRGHDLMGRFFHWLSIPPYPVPPLGSDVSLSGVPTTSMSCLCLCPTSEMGRNSSQAVLLFPVCGPPTPVPNSGSRTFCFPQHGTCSLLFQQQRAPLDSFARKQ